MSRVTASNGKKHLRQAARDLQSAKDDLAFAIRDVNTDPKQFALGYIDDVEARLAMVTRALAKARTSISGQAAD